MKKTVSAMAILLLAVVDGLVPASGQSQPQSPPASQRCFYDVDFENWKAPNPQTMYIRVKGHRYFQLDLANKCYDLMMPTAHLITHIHGSDLVCSPVDWDLKVSPDIHEIPEPCIVKSMRPLSPAEVAALPPKFMP